MSTVTSGLASHGRDASWAGSFECAGPCGRKRLVAAEFSKSQLQRRQKDDTVKIKCKQCVEAAATAERQEAAARQAERTAAAPSSVPPAAAAIDVSDSEASVLPAPPQTQTCSACNKALPADAFNRTQLVKGAGKQRCRECVDKAEQASAAESTVKKDAAIEEARKALQQAEVSGDAAQKLVAASRLSALEGEKVTGLKPVVLGKGGRGRGGWRARGGGKGGK